MKCHGHTISIKTLKVKFSQEVWQHHFSNLENYSKKCEKLCPHCQDWMPEIILYEEHNKIYVDKCSACNLIWFDSQELEDTFHKGKYNFPDKNPTKNTTPSSELDIVKARQAFAHAEIALLRKEQDLEDRAFVYELMGAVSRIFLY